MYVYLYCFFYILLVGFVDLEQVVFDEVNGVIVDVWWWIVEFDLELVVFFVFDYYNGFFYDVMLLFCFGVGVIVIGDFVSVVGDLLVFVELVEVCVYVIFNSGIDLVVLYNMQVDYGFVQLLEFLLGGLDSVLVLLVFINGVVVLLLGF